MYELLKSVFFYCKSNAYEGCIIHMMNLEVSVNFTNSCASILCCKKYLKVVADTVHFWFTASI